jgi:hypothetical protein
MKEKIIDYIVTNGLTTPSRAREYVYRRAFLSYLLRENGLTFQEIADIFNRTHSTIIHAVQFHRFFMDLKDELYLFNIQKEIEYFNYVEKRCIFTDIENANNTTDLFLIKERIKENQY